MSAWPVDRSWPCCSHCLDGPDDFGDGHGVPCLICQTDTPSLFDDGDPAEPGDSYTGGEPVSVPTENGWDA